MVASTDDRHDFVVGFADALTRLAYLLTVTEGVEFADVTSNAQRRAIAALAQTVRRWHDVQATGAPEPVAVEALLNRLPRRRRARVSSETPTADPSSDAIPDDETPDDETPDDETPDADVDRQRLRDSIWQAWVRLPERQRVPFVFAEVSPVSRRLDTLDVPVGFMSPHRLETLAGQAVSTIRAAVDADRTLQVMPVGREFEVVLAETLDQRAHDATSPPDPFASVVDLVRQSRRRGLAAGAAVIVVIAAVSVAIVNTSTSRDQTKQLTSGAASSASQQPQAALDNAAVREGNAATVNWPTRGSLKDDAALIAGVRSTFVANHLDATGQVQVLLATNTPWFRAAYVTAQTRTGVLRSWFYGSPGKTSLVEGSFSYAAPILRNDVVAAAVADTQGHDVLLVIGPPNTKSVELAGAESNVPLDQFAALPVDDGIVVDDISGAYVPALQLHVFATDAEVWNGPVPEVQLAGAFGIGAPSVTAAPATPGAAPASSSGVAVAPSAATSDPTIKRVLVERGQPDPSLLGTALAAERQYVVTGTFEASGLPVVVWAGTDLSGTVGVLLRVKTLHLSDLLIAVWANAPGDATAYRLAPDAPDTPIAIQYDGAAGASVGVLAPHGITQVGLVVDGADVGVSQVGANGFATLLVGKQYGVLAEQTLAVDLFDANGRQISREPVTLSS